MTRRLKSWRAFGAKIDPLHARHYRRAERASIDPEYKAHQDAVRRLPAAVREAWELYLADENREIYPHGFCFHFPTQWRWMELEAAKASGKQPLSQRALGAAGLGPETTRAPDGSVDRWPSGRPMGTNSPRRDLDAVADAPAVVDPAVVREPDGSFTVYDPETGEIIADIDPPF